MKRNLFFILMLTGCLWFAGGIAVRGQLDSSTIENRQLQKWPEFTVNKFLDGSFQKNVDNFLNDQLMYSEELKAIVKKLERMPSDSIIHLIEQNKEEPENSDVDVDTMIEHYEYIALGKGIYRYGESGYLMYRPGETIDFSSYQRFADAMNPLIEQLDEVMFYAYFITTSSAIDFNAETPENRYFPYVCEHLNIKNIQCFEVDGFNDYQKYFYRSDHHWNHVGSYMGYRDVLSMLKPDESPVVPLDEVCFDDLDFQGSSARLTAYFDTHETFCVYQMPVSNDIITLINGIEEKYGHEEEYFSHLYQTEIGASHYGIFYGGDNGEVVFINPEKEGNLLVLGNSFDNAIVKLLSQHYHEVRVIDWRYFEAELGYPFDLADYVQTNHVQQVLFIGDNWFYKIDN